MPDLEEVTSTIAGCISSALSNPDGSSKSGVQTRITPGWPVTDDLKAILAAGQVMITVYPLTGASTNTTRHQAKWTELSPPVITTTVSISDNVITLGGTITLPLNVGVQLGWRKAAYAAQSNDTLATFTAGVTGAMQSAGMNATASGTQITVVDGERVKVALGSSSVFCREAYRTKQTFVIATWAPSQTLRLATTKVFTGSFFAQPSIALPDYSTGMLLYQRDAVSDTSEVEGLYRRDQYLTVEYSVFETDEAFDVVTTHP